MVSSYQDINGFGVCFDLGKKCSKMPTLYIPSLWKIRLVKVCSTNDISNEYLRNRGRYLEASNYCKWPSFVCLCDKVLQMSMTATAFARTN